MHLFFTSLIHLQYLFILLDYRQIVLDQVCLLRINGRLVYLLILSDVITTMTFFLHARVATQCSLMIRSTLGSAFGTPFRLLRFVILTGLRTIVEIKAVTSAKQINFESGRISCLIHGIKCASIHGDMFHWLIRNLKKSVLQLEILLASSIEQLLALVHLVIFKV